MKVNHFFPTCKLSFQSLYDALTCRFPMSWSVGLWLVITLWCPDLSDCVILLNPTLSYPIRHTKKGTLCSRIPFWPVKYSCSALTDIASANYFRIYLINVCFPYRCTGNLHNDFGKSALRSVFRSLNLQKYASNLFKIMSHKSVFVQNHNALNLWLFPLIPSSPSPIKTLISFSLCSSSHFPTTWHSPTYCFCSLGLCCELVFFY